MAQAVRFHDPVEDILKRFPGTKCPVGNHKDIVPFHITSFERFRYGEDLDGDAIRAVLFSQDEPIPNNTVVVHPNLLGNITPSSDAVRAMLARPVPDDVGAVDPHEGTSTILDISPLPEIFCFIFPVLAEDYSQWELILLSLHKGACKNYYMTDLSFFRSTSSANDIDDSVASVQLFMKTAFPNISFKLRSAKTEKCAIWERQEDSGVAVIANALSLIFRRDLDEDMGKAGCLEKRERFGRMVLHSALRNEQVLERAREIERGTVRAMSVASSDDFMLSNVLVFAFAAFLIVRGFRGFPQGGELGRGWRESSFRVAFAIWVWRGRNRLMILSRVLVVLVVFVAFLT